MVLLLVAAAGRFTKMARSGGAHRHTEAFSQVSDRVCSCCRRNAHFCRRKADFRGEIGIWNIWGFFRAPETRIFARSAGESHWPVHAATDEGVGSVDLIRVFFQ